MALEGKGLWIWNVPDCEGGNPTAIANTAQSIGLTHVSIKIANGIYPFNVSKTNQDYVAPLVPLLHARGIQVWGWHYVLGTDPVGEARQAVRRIQQLGLDGYAIDAEGEYKQSGRASAARTFMAELRKSLPNFPISLCSYRYPSYHPQLPWREFLEKCDYNMPQMYWEQSHNPAAQLSRCLREFQGITPFRPVYPLGSAYGNAGWAATPEDVTEFLNAARSLSLKSAALYSWDFSRNRLPLVWDAIARFSWGQVTLPAADLVTQYITALNSRDANRIVQLFNPNGVHVTAIETIQGSENIRNWYLIFLNLTLPSATFRLTGSSGSGPTRHFNWQATSPKGRVLDGSDTIGIINDKIAYHYTSFNISPNA